MKYKLINKQTGEEHLCDKVTIDGFEYYVSEEEIKVGDWYTWDGNKNNAPSLCTDTYNEYSILESMGFAKFYKVITTTNPSIDLPKVVDIVQELAYDWLYDEETESKASQGYALKPMEYGFIKGYNKAKETYPFSEKDMESFLKFSIEYRMYNDLEGLYKTTKELLELWEEQRPKIIYYE